MYHALVDFHVSTETSVQNFLISTHVFLCTIISNYPGCSISHYS